MDNDLRLFVIVTYICDHGLSWRLVIVLRETVSLL